MMFQFCKPWWKHHSWITEYCEPQDDAHQVCDKCYKRQVLHY